MTLLVLQLAIALTWKGWPVVVLTKLMSPQKECAGKRVNVGTHMGCCHGLARCWLILAGLRQKRGENSFVDGRPQWGLWNGLLEVKGGVQYRQGLLSEDC